MTPSTSRVLPGIHSPRDLRRLSGSELTHLAAEIRALIIKTVRANGGHLAPSLGVVELTIALHRVFESPRDKIVWDVGHQCYAHKILTGRRERFATLRRFGGLSGFCRRDESPHDPFGAGHASTSISAALGIATARDLRGEQFQVVAVIGDGGLSGGLAFEGLDNAGVSGRNLVVILNDNNMSISPTVGALSRHLTEIITHPLFERAKRDVWALTAKLPRGTQPVRQAVRRLEESLKGLLTPGLFFENLGFRYLGPVDGHKLPELITVLGKVKRMRGPILVHVVTQKGRGLPAAEADPRKYHGIAPAAPAAQATAAVQATPAAHDVPAVRARAQVAVQAPRVTYTQVFGRTMVELAAVRPELVAVSAAMCDGTGLAPFAERYPDRFFDVGIAEGHAVTFAAGLATQGLRPVVAIYSTFLQRAFDHLIHDVALQKLAVIFALDRAGLVGDDGATHHGAFDLAYLGSIPGMVVAAPRSGRELRDLLGTAAAHHDGPFAIRFPRAAVPDPGAAGERPRMTPVGSWELCSTGAAGHLLATGPMVAVAEAAAERLRRQGLDLGVVNARYVKPLDEKLLGRVAAGTFVATLEEGTLAGGLGAQVAGALADRYPAAERRLLRFGLPDGFTPHGPRGELLARAGLTPEQIADQIGWSLRGAAAAGGAGRRPRGPVALGEQ